MEDLLDTKELTFAKLQDFTYYFLKKVEDQLKSSLEILEGASTSKSSSTAGDILAGAATIIPVVGKGISSGIKQGDEFVAHKIYQNTAIALSDIVYFSRNHKEETRRTLIKAAYEIFSCYEAQFAQLTCNGGPTRAVQKMGYDAGQRLLDYCCANKVKVIDEALVIKSIVCDTSNLLNSLGIIRLGGTVTANKNLWKISKIYTKVGVYDKANAACYKNKGTNAKKYGHRLKFSFESIGDDWVKDDLTYDYKQIIDLKEFEEDYPTILEYIIKKNPEEYAKYDREIKHHETLQKLSHAQNILLEDSEIKHQESRSTMFKLHEDLKGETSKQHETVTQLLQNIKTTQEIIIREIPNERPPSYSVEPNIQVVTEIVEKKMKEEKILPKIEREVKASLAKMDPTKEFKRLKKNIRDIKKVTENVKLLKKLKFPKILRDS